VSSQDRADARTRPAHALTDAISGMSDPHGETFTNIESGVACRHKSVRWFATLQVLRASHPS
jgi:hypothetical protein